MDRKTVAADRTHDALVAFLDAHLGAPRNDDVGPMLGQASLLRELPAVDVDARSLLLCSDAINAALTSEATREPLAAAPAVGRDARRTTHTS